MSEPFLAEVRMIGFNFPPRGWAFCDGQILPINQNQSLYSLLGTTYGGDGRTSFALPDLRGRTPIHTGSDGSGGTFHSLGQKGGEEIHTLTATEMPSHIHEVKVSSDNATQNVPTDRVFARAREVTYHELNNPIQMQSTMVGNTGGGQPRENMQPFLTINFCIALQGLFPPRN